MNIPTNYDASFCGKLPLHQTNAIQGHGVLLVFDEALERVQQVSQNIHELLQAEAKDIVGASLDSVLQADAIQHLRQVVTQPFEGRFPVTLTFQNPLVPDPQLCFVHKTGEGYILETELKKYYHQPARSFIDSYQRVAQAVQYITPCTSIAEVCTVAATQLRTVTGFDKVMIYRFDEQWNGTVVAEDAADGMETYMGLTFPASDIPKPAREMYRKKNYRLIPNREYTPARLYPLLNPITNTFTNLLDADLRSVAAVHLEYLKNMNVMASMSLRILYNDALWGLIACHHRAPKYLSFEACAEMEMISMVLSQKITSLQRAEEVSIKEKLTEKFSKVVAQFVSKTNIPEAFEGAAPGFKDFADASGVALCWEGEVYTEGDTPAPGDIDTLLYWLGQKEVKVTFHENKLPLKFEAAEAFADKGSGILALPIQPDRGNYLLAFRPELVKVISWGGNPHEAIRFEKDSTAYHPRHSFQVWKESTRFTSAPWHPEEIAAAEQLRNFIVQHVLNLLNA